MYCAIMSCAISTAAIPASSMFRPMPMKTPMPCAVFISTSPLVVRRVPGWPETKWETKLLFSMVPLMNCMAPRTSATGILPVSAGMMARSDPVLTQSLPGQFSRSFQSSSRLRLTSEEALTTQLSPSANKLRMLLYMMTLGFTPRRMPKPSNRVGCPRAVSPISGHLRRPELMSTVQRGLSIGPLESSSFSSPRCIMASGKIRSPFSSGTSPYHSRI